MTDSKIDLTEKEKIEELLKNYRSIKSVIRINVIEKCPGYSLPSVDYSSPSTSGGGDGKYSKVEDYIIKKYGEEGELFRLIKVRDIIKSGLSSLSEEKREIVKYLYFENLTQLETAMRMDCSENTISSRKKEILNNLEKVGISKAWSIWEEFSYQ